MSASQSPELSDIHPTTVAETLSVSTDPPAIGNVSQALSVTVSDRVTDAQTIPSVGASISVPDTAQAASIGERSSTALLNLASSTLNLTDILNAQQQALEQFQCQLQLAQQTEAINQRLDAIERTLNSLIQQKAAEEAAKLKQVTPIRPSQQVVSQSPPDGAGPSGEGKKKKLPRELCAKVRSSYHALNLEYKIDERFLSPINQRVTDSLIDTVYTDTSGAYTVKDIKRATHRYYESRRRLGIEEMPDRQEKAAEQRKKRKYRARQQRAYDRRKKFVRESELRYWEMIKPGCMTEESDAEEGERIVTHQLLWRSEFLNQFLLKLDNRYERSRKPGTTSSVKRERVAGLPSTSQPPFSLPSWMIDPAYKMPTTGVGNSVCIDPTDDADTPTGVGDDVTTYTTLIGDMQDVHDDSSDFELPDTVVA